MKKNNQANVNKENLSNKESNENKDIFKKASELFDTLLKAKDFEYAWENTPEDLKQNKEFILYLVDGHRFGEDSKNPYDEYIYRIAALLPENLYKDSDFLRSLITTSTFFVRHGHIIGEWSVINNIPMEFRTKDVLSTAIQTEFSARDKSYLFSYPSIPTYRLKEILPEELFSDKDFILKVLPYCSSELLSIVSPELQNDKEVVSKAINKGAGAFKYASPEIRSDKQYVLGFINSKYDFEFEDYGSMFKIIESFKNDYDVAEAAIKKGFALHLFSPELQRNESLIKLSVSSSTYISEVLGNNGGHFDQNETINYLCSNMNFVKDLIDLRVSRFNSLPTWFFSDNHVKYDILKTRQYTYLKNTSCNTELNYIKEFLSVGAEIVHNSFNQDKKYTRKDRKDYKDFTRNALNQLSDKLLSEKDKIMKTVNQMIGDVKQF